MSQFREGNYCYIVGVSPTPPSPPYSSTAAAALFRRFLGEITLRGGEVILVPGWGGQRK